jgi:YVTN family beta-propeller protein
MIWAQIKRIKVGAGPHGVTFSPDGEEAYVAVSRENKVVIIDTFTKEIHGEIEVSGSPYWIAAE